MLRRHYPGAVHLALAGRFPAGHVAGELVESVDFAATVSSLAGVDALETGDGHDLGLLLRGGAAPCATSR